VIHAHPMRIGAYQIRVAALPAVAALLMLALLVSAGLWQLRRAEDKRAMAVEQSYRAEKRALVLTPGLAGSADLEKLRYRHTSATGHYRDHEQYLLDNRTHNGVAGYHVLTPLRLQDSDVYVLVNRGWVPVGPDRRQLPRVAVSEQPMTVQGLIVAPPAAGLDLGASGYDNPGWPRVVQRVELKRIQEQLDRPLLPFVVRLSADSEHGYVRAWQMRTGLTPERHVGYAVQWFALAAALAGLCLWVAVKRLPTADHEC
jgi:surfeit locus 1 family protein